MQVINRFRLRDFWIDHSRSENELRSWFQLVSSYDWDSSGALATSFPRLQTHSSLAAFDLRGSSFFVVTSLDYGQNRIWIRDVQIHSDLRTESWKTLVSDQAETPRSFDDLSSAFPLRPIRRDEQLRNASRQLDALLAQPERTPDEQDYLDVLTLLVHDYEARNAPVPPVSGAEVLRVLISEHQLSQAELIPMLGGKQRVMALLQGTRPLDLRQATRAARYFRLPVETFMDPDDLEIELPRPTRRRA